MKTMLKKAGLGVALAATSLAVAAPAEAQRWRHYDDGDDAAAAAIIAGVAGLAIGAALADDDRYYDRYDRDYYYDRYPRYNHYPRYNYYPRYRHRYDRRCWRDRVWDPYARRYVRVRRCR